MLSLYSNGLLACSMNVGGTVTGGECPVSTSIGTQSVVVIYTSITTTATETYTEQVEPFATSTTLAVSSSPDKAGTLYTVTAGVASATGYPLSDGTVELVATDANGVIEAYAGLSPGASCTIFYEPHMGYNAYYGGEGGDPGSCDFGLFTTPEGDSVTVSGAFTGTVAYLHSSSSAVGI